MNMLLFGGLALELIFLLIGIVTSCTLLIKYSMQYYKPPQIEYHPLSKRYYVMDKNKYITNSNNSTYDSQTFDINKAVFFNNEQDARECIDLYMEKHYKKGVVTKTYTK